MSELSVKQLFEKTEDGYVPFNPKVDLNSILESITERSIAFIFHHYNHFNAEWTNTAELTRAQVPPQLRRNGLWLSYNKDLHTKVTERFIGTDLDAADQTKWVKDEYWELLDFELLQKAAEEAIKNIFQNLSNYPELRQFLRLVIRNWLGDVVDENMLRQLIREALGGDIVDLLMQAINDYLHSDEFETYINNILSELIDQEKIDAAVAEYLEQHLGDLVDAAVSNYFASPEGQDTLKDVLTDLLDDLLADYFADIQQTIIDMERVIANALARHEMAITELQNQIITN